MKCDHYAEIIVQVGEQVGIVSLICSRVPGHKGECSVERGGFSSHGNKRVATNLKLHWPSPKMLRRKLSL